MSQKEKRSGRKFVPVHQRVNDERNPWCILEHHGNKSDIPHYKFRVVYDGQE